MKERGKLPAILTISSVIGVVGLLSQLAFSRRSKNEIIGKAGNRSEITGSEQGETSLHCMHVDHSKNETYDDPVRGMLVTPIEHLVYHRVHRGVASEIGLTEKENEEAMRLLQGLIARYP